MGGQNFGMNGNNGYYGRGGMNSGQGSYYYNKKNQQQNGGNINIVVSSSSLGRDKSGRFSKKVVV